VSFSDVLNFLDVLSGSTGGTRPRPGPAAGRSGPAAGRSGPARPAAVTGQSITQTTTEPLFVITSAAHIR